MLSLSIPAKRDPIARSVLLGLVGLVCFLAIARFDVAAPEAAQAQGVIILGTPVPTPALPTPEPGQLAIVTTPELIMVPPPGSPMAVNQAPANYQPIPVEQPAAAPAPAVENNDYLANVGAQAPHSPRGDVAQAPAYSTGPIAVPADNGVIIIDNPNPPSPPAVDAMAAAVPPISQEQAAVIGERQSNGCAVGQVFYPRTGCHTPGAGGPQPGAVGVP